MSRRFLRTAEVAAAVGVHPNTVRMYEAWGLLQEIPRTPAGYRQFTQAHVDQMRLARKAYEGQWPGRPIHQAAVLPWSSRRWKYSALRPISTASSMA